MSSRHPIPAARQQGITLLEVLVAMLVFLIGASAMTLLAANAFTANAQASRTFIASSTSRSLLATIEGNPQILGSLGGTALGAASSSTASSSTAPGVLQNWWTAQRQIYPDLQGVQLSTQPNPCSPTAPCQITATLTLRSAFGGSIQRTFVMQDGF
jgi:type IV pilus modification protein PilV